MSNGVLAFLVLTVLSAIVAFAGFAPEGLETAARVSFFGFLTLTLFSGALTRWDGPTPHLEG